MINESKVKCFLTAAETLSFTETSKRLYISQQAVSKHIAELEEQIGTRLFARDHHHVALTAEGEKIADWFRQVSTDWESLLDEIHSTTPAGRVQSIHIGYQNWMDFGSAPGRAMLAMRQKYPEVNLIGERHTPTGLLELLRTETLDVALLHRRFISQKMNLIVTPLFDTQILMIVSEENVRNTVGASYTDFQSEPLLMDQLEGETRDIAAKRARREAKRYGFTPSHVVVVPNRDSIYTEAELGRGIFFGSAMAQMPDGMRLVKYDTGVSDTICCVRLKENRKRRVRDFAEQLQREYKGLHENNG